MSPRELFGSTLLATGSETARSRERTRFLSFAIALLVVTVAALVAYHWSYFHEAPFEPAEFRHIPALSPPPQQKPTFFPTAFTRNENGPRRFSRSGPCVFRQAVYLAATEADHEPG